MKPYLSFLKHDGQFVTVGMLEPTPEGAIDFSAVSMTRLHIAGSLIGSVEETQEVLDFCAERGVRPDIEVIAIENINTAFNRVVDGDVRFRLVIDNSTLPKAGEELPHALDVGTPPASKGATVWNSNV